MKKISHFTSLVLSVSFITFFGCSKSLAPTTGHPASSTTMTESVSPNLLPGQCPYPCTDIRCKGYSSGYCAKPVDLITLGDSTQTVTTLMTNAFDSLTNVNFAELSSDLGLSGTLNASDIDLSGAIETYDANANDTTGKAIVCNFYQNSNSKTTNYAFAYLTVNGSGPGEPVIIKTVSGSSITIYDLAIGAVYTITNYGDYNWSLTETTGNYMTGGGAAIRSDGVTPLLKPSCTGANVNACFLDVYTNHGWLSLFVSVETAFLPQTAAAFAVGCAALNCL